ncbi:MAG: hypothetical protein IIB69_11205 [Proteobacteria bacterium]|nr:hypothetical protein [Pseudomonadota bacterium]
MSDLAMGTGAGFLRVAGFFGAGFFLLEGVVSDLAMVDRVRVFFGAFPGAGFRFHLGGLRVTALGISRPELFDHPYR